MTADQVVTVKQWEGTVRYVLLELLVCRSVEVELWMVPHDAIRTDLESLGLNHRVARCRADLDVVVKQPRAVLACNPETHGVAAAVERLRYQVRRVRKNAAPSLRVAARLRQRGERPQEHR